MLVRPDEDEYLGEEGERTSPRSLFASGWVRALLVLGALVLLLFVSLPYLLRYTGRERAVDQRATTAKPGTTPGPAPASPPAMTAAPAAAPGRAEPREPPAPRGPAPTPPKVSPGSPRVAARTGSPKDTGAPAASGEYWVQAGAFQEERNAQRLAEQLRNDQRGASVSRIARGTEGTTRHELFITGANAGAVNTLLQGKGSARAVAGGVVVEPPLELNEAVALSKRLAGEGLTVKIRRVGEGAPATFHVVSVGPYPTRASADSAAKELTARGIRGFVREGPAR